PAHHPPGAVPPAVRDRREPGRFPAAARRRVGQGRRPAIVTEDPMTRTRTFYWMVVPALVLFLLFHTLPVLQGFYYSLTNYPGYGSYDFIGLKNYANLFRDDRILDAYVFTFQFAIVATVLTNALALAIALGLNARIRLRTTLRGIFFIPNVLAILIVGYIFNY